MMFIGLMQANNGYARIVPTCDKSFLAVLHHPYLDSMCVEMPIKMLQHMSPDITFDEYGPDTTQPMDEETLLSSMMDRTREHAIIVTQNKSL